MTPERLQQLRHIVETALDHPSETRPTYLDEVCADDVDLRRSALDMLAAADDASEFMELPENPDVDELFLNVAAGEPIGTRFGPYLISQVLAAGGMGTVYRAIRADDEFDREVAIKLINRGGDTAGNLRRFHAERQVLANLDHPNIARMLDGGTTPDGRPFIVMEFIEGKRIDRFCDAQTMTIPARLRLFMRVCAAVHHAHQNLIVHRDIKPSNILVTTEGVPKLLDFGISRLLSGEGGAELTASQRRMLTPQYASPEQIRGETITTAADVYSLGVVLYELISGCRPYDLTGLSSYEREHIVCESEPCRPSVAAATQIRAGEVDDAETRARRAHTLAFDRAGTVDQLRRQLRGDLDNIVMKALAKDPARRYPTVLDLAADVERHLDGLPVQARAATFAYATSKFIRRNRSAVATTVMVMLAILASIATALFGLDEARLERNAAIQAKADGEEVTRFLQDLIIDANPYRTGREVTVTELLDGAAEKIDRDFAERPSVQALIHFAIAQTHEGMWRWRRTATHAERALDLNRQQYGARHAAVAESLALYGRALTFLRDPRCVDVQREALMMHLELFGEEDARTAMSYGDLAFALWHGVGTPRWVEAEWYYRQAFAMFDALNVPPSLDRARCLYGFADMQAQRDLVDEAEALYREAGDLYRTFADESNQYMIECLRDHATLMRETRRYKEARVLLEEVMDIMPDLEGDPVLGDTCWQLGMVLHACGEPVLAEEMFRRAIRVEIDLTENFGARPVDLTDAAAGFMISESSGQIATPYAEIYRSLYSFRHNDVELMEHFGWLADLLRRLGRVQESAAVYEVCGIAVEEWFGAEHWRTAEIHGHYGACLTELGRYEDAERVLLDSYRVLRVQIGANALRTRSIYQRLSDLYDAWGKPERLIPATRALGRSS